MIYNKNAKPVTVRSCVFWGNTGGPGVIFDENPGGAGGLTNVEHSIVQGGHAGVGNIGADPLFVNAANPKGADGKWGTADDGLHLNNGSPALDTGLNAHATISDDLTRRPRIVDGDSDFVAILDMGSYEKQTGPVPPLSELDAPVLTSDRAGSANSAYRFSAVRFSGTSQGVEIPDAALELAPSSLTASAWVYWDGTYEGTAADGAIFLYKGKYDPFPRMSYSLEIRSGMLVGRSDTAGFKSTGTGVGPDLLSSTNPVPVNAWFHCALTVDDATKTAKLYVNGALNDTKVFTGSDYLEIFPFRDIAC